MQQAVTAAAKYRESRAWCLEELGNMYFKTGRWAEAEPAYTDAISITPMIQYAGVLYDMVDEAAKLEGVANQKANRTLAMVYANQDRNLTESLELAQCIGGSFESWRAGSFVLLSCGQDC